MNNYTLTPLGGWLNGWRLAGWSALLALLALPAVAMMLTDEVDWTGGDFVFAAVLLGVLGAGMEIAVRVGKSGAHTAGLVLSALAGFLTVWSNAAVGIIRDAPINAAFFGIIFVAALASLAVRFRPRAMAWIACVVIAAELLTGLVAQAWGIPDWVPVAFVASLWIIPALMFLRAARG